MSQIIKTQLCLGEFKTGQNCLQVEKGENYTKQKKKTLYTVIVFKNSKLLIDVNCDIFLFIVKFDE